MYLVKLNSATGNVDVIWKDSEWIKEAPGGAEAYDAWKRFKRNSRLTNRRSCPESSEVSLLFAADGFPDPLIVPHYSYYLL